MKTFKVYAYAMVEQVFEYQAESMDDALERWANDEGPKQVAGEVEHWEDPHGVEVDGEYHEVEQDDDITCDASL